MAKTRSQQQDAATSASLAADFELTNRGRSRSRSETRVDAKEAVDLAYVTAQRPPPMRPFPSPLGLES